MTGTFTAAAVAGDPNSVRVTLLGSNLQPLATSSVVGGVQRID